MTETKHTPGGWEAVIPKKRHIHEGADITSYTVYSKLSRGKLREAGHAHYREDPDCVDNVRICDQFVGDMTLEEAQANGNLLASAPTLQAKIDRLKAEKAELVKACRLAEAVLAEHEQYDDDDDVPSRESEAAEACRTAIAKAEPS